MTRQRIRHTSLTPRIRGLALTSSALVLLAMFCCQLATVSLSAWRIVMAPGPASLDQALSAVAGSIALGLTVWLLHAVSLSLLAALVSGSSTLARAVANSARFVAPVILRNAVAALLGVTIIASPAAADAGPAAAHRAVTVRPALLANVRSAHPTADRPLSPSWAPAAQAPAAQARASQARASQAPAGEYHPSTTSTIAPERSPGSKPSGSGRQPGVDLLGSDSDLSPGWIPSRPSSKPSKAAVADVAPVAAAARRPRVDPADEIVVRRGDTLWEVASRHLGPGATDGEIALDWPHWFAANRAVIGSDPDHLVPGQRLRAPDRDPAGTPAADLETMRGRAGR
jgi:nucleoid-associated protein YgaU